MKKTCIHCKVEKPVGNFYKATKERYQSSCKLCWLARQRIYDYNKKYPELEPESHTRIKRLSEKRMSFLGEL